jgi:ankyrin repeat protein
MRLWVRSVLGVALLAATPAVSQVGFGNEGDQMLQALQQGERSKALKLIDDSSSGLVNYRGRDGDGALHIVTRARDGNWMGYLLSKGSNPNLNGKNGDTALIIASRLGYVEGVARLLMQRADVNKVNRNGENALIVAVQQRQPKIVRYLLAAGADPDKRDFAAGYSAREYAKRDSRMPELLRLIETTPRPKPQVVGPTKK